MIVKSIKNQQGQSLVEVVIALGIAVIIVIAFTNATITSVRNSQFSKNQNLSTKYAQESLELIRAVRDQNTSASVTDGGSLSTWGDLWGIDLYDTSATGVTGMTGYCFNLDKSTLHLTKRTFVNPCADKDASGVVQDENLDGLNLFYRKINITNADNDKNKKQINVRVYWSDSRGQHNTDVTTFLTNWQ
jgi:Tfp pilus assembly protein PilV